MCEHVRKIRTAERMVEIKYRILGFHSESDTDWLFEVQTIERRVDCGAWKSYERAQDFLAFPKKHKTGEKWVTDDDGVRRKVLIYEYNNPPGFYNRLRNEAVLSGRMKIQGDDAPLLEDGDLFA